MKKEMKILSVVLVSVFLLILITSIVAALEPTTFIKDLFTKWSGGNTDINVAKILFFVLITLLVYALLGYFPGIKGKPILQTAVALVVSFLATAFITPDEIYTMLIGYNALGITLGAFLPIIILAFFTFAVAEDGNKAGMMIEFLLWIVFLLFLIYRFIYALTVQKVDTTILTWYGIAMLIVVGAIIFNTQVVKWIGEKSLTAAKVVGAQAVDKGAAGIKLGERFLEKMSKKEQE